ncbi:MAG: InlB B-repeat-containing protein [Candidatus Dojkabacteria bacterium]
MKRIITFKKYFFYPLLAIFFLIISFFIINLNGSVEKVSAQTCPPGCYWNSGFQTCTGPGGCRPKGSGCYSGEEDWGAYCCDPCTASCGTCGNCDPYTNPGCPANYGSTNTGCSSTSISCTRYDDCGACGTTSGTCWLFKYTLAYAASTGGSLSGTTSQSVCRGSNGTAVTANPSSGYYFRIWSDNVTSNPRTDTNVTANKSVTAYFNGYPTAPTSLLAEGAANPTRVTDTTPEFSAIYNDPAPATNATHYRIQVNTNSSFSGTMMWDSGQTSVSAIANGTRSPDISYAGTALSLNGATYYWRIHFWDSYGAMGAWSATAQFTMNTPPSSPTSLQAEGATNPTGVTDTRPEFRAIFQDPNTGDTGNYYEINVNTNSSFTGTVMWNSGQVAMTATNIGSYSPYIEYAGTNPLALNGTTYYWRIRFTDNNGTVGAWSATAQFTMNTPPSANDPKVNNLVNPTGVITLTPSFTAAFQDTDTGDTGNYYEINVNTNSSFTGTVMWNSGQQSVSPIAIGATSPAITYGGTALSYNGATYYWRIRFTDNNGTVGSWSATAQFTMNSNPSSPTNLLTEGLTNPQNVSDMTPEFSAIFQDSDSGNTGIYYQIHVNTNSSFTGTSMWDSGKTSMSPTAIGARSPDISYAGTTLTQSGEIYYWRIKFWDNLNVEGEWSAVANFRVQRAPNAPTSLQVDGLTNPGYVLTLTPNFSARYNDVNGHAATAYEINVNTANDFSGTVMWNSGKQTTSVTEGSRSPNYTYAGTALQSDDTTYYWRIRFWDSDDLQGDWSATNTFVSRLNRQLLKGLQLKGLRVN